MSTHLMSRASQQLTVQSYQVGIYNTANKYSVCVRRFVSVKSKDARLLNYRKDAARVSRPIEPNMWMRANQMEIVCRVALFRPLVVITEHFMLNILMNFHFIRVIQ